MMKNYMAKTLSFVLTLVMLLSALPATVAIAADYKDAKASNNAPPIVAVLEVDTVDPETQAAVTKTVEYGVIEQDGEYNLYLPGVIDIGSVSVKNIGKDQLYDERDGSLYSAGEIGVFDFSAGSVTVYEYSKAYDQYYSYSLNVYCGSEIPALHFTLDDPLGSGDVLSWINEDKENRATGSLLMVDGYGNVVYDNTCDTIKGRGNTSFVAPGIQTDNDKGYQDDKKSLSIKLSSKAELIEGAGKMKKWALLHMRISEAFHYDWTGICSHLGFQTFSALANDEYYGTKSQYVDVYIDGEYRGVYILVERVDINAAVDITDQEEFVTSESSSTKRVTDASDPAIAAGISEYRYTSDAKAVGELDLTGGYLMEITLSSIEECGFATANGMYVSIKAPEVCTKEQVQYIAKYVQDFENALFSRTGYNSDGKHYSEYIDCQSLADMLLTYAFFQNWELFRTSTYMYIDSKDSEHPLLTFGPVWDFETGAQVFNTDATFWGQHNNYAVHQQYVWMQQLWRKGDFMELISDRAALMDEIIKAQLELGAPMDGVLSAQDIVAEAHSSLAMNWKRWDLEDYLNSRSKYSGHDNDYDYYYETYLAALNKRKSNWDKLWDPSKYVLGNHIICNKDKASGKYMLTCVLYGDAGATYSWYKVADDNITIQAIDGQTGSVLYTDEPGTYICKVKGAHNSYWSGAAGSIFSEKNVSLYTKPVSTSGAIVVDRFPDANHVAGDWEVLVAGSCVSEGIRVKRCTECEEHEVLVSEFSGVGSHDEGRWTVTREPTADRKGKEKLLCTVCEAELDSRDIPKLFNNKFVDVDMTKWYGKAVEFAVTRDLFNGVSANKFDPNGSMTRAMLVTVLCRLEGVSVNNDRRSTFTDVESKQWYTGAVIWASKEGIVNGVGNNKFDPNGTVTREQVAAILYRYAQYKGITTDERADLSVFEDAGKISAYAEEAMAWINGVQIIKGVSATKIAPRDNCTRAQVAEMLRLYYDKYLAN